MLNIHNVITQSILPHISIETSQIMNIINHFRNFRECNVVQLLVYGYLDISEYILARCKYAPFLKLVKYGVLQIFLLPTFQ